MHGSSNSKQFSIMNKYFVVLQDNTLKRILVSEQETKEVLAVKSLEQLKSESSFDGYINRVVYKLITHNWDGFSDGFAYNWECIESEFSDQSSLGKKYSVFETKGKAIQRMLADGFSITIDGVEFTN
jgi:hypothetical protein